MNDVRLTDAERAALANTVRDAIGRSYGFEAICRQVERIVAERVRVVEGERDAARAAHRDTIVAWFERQQGMDVVHEQVDGVCVGCKQFGEPVEWLLAEARGHSDEVA